MDILTYFQSTYGVADDFDRDCNLVDCALLDSLGMVELLYYLEDNGIEIHLTRVGIDNFNTVNKINRVIASMQNQ